MSDYDDQDELNRLGNKNWVQALAYDYLVQQKKQKRMRYIYRTVIVLLIVVVLMMDVPSKDQDKKSKPHVAVINVNGEIAANSRGSADNFIKALRKVAKNKSVNALMLEINSPGGSPVQADEMYNALVQYRKSNPKIPVIAVCTDMCASAAYYVAVGADQIYANPSSLVGSIGVLYNGFGFTDLMEKVGVTRRLITAGKNKAFLDPFSPEKPANVEKLKSMLEIVHDEFKQAVLKGRGSRLKVTDETFSGLFWTGIQAKKMGLIDEFGSIRSGFKHKPRVVYSAVENLFDRINQQIGESVANVIVNRLGLGASPLK